ncbi:MAG: TlpA disulfide reductase family protein [Gammaproteobacteria bacterium]|jgi:thiol-disulfide isomerase/thioredoxin
MRNRQALSRAVVSACLLLVSLPSLAADTLPKGVLVLDGRAAPPLVLNNLDGERWDISESRGRWLFVHFWASWCGPCREEMPTIQAIFPKVDASQLEIVLVNTAESEDTVFSFLAEVAPDLTPLVDADGGVTERWQPRGLPATFFVDPEGRLRYLALGGRPWDTIDYLGFLQRLAR